jgi:hypothetical protein
MGCGSAASDYAYLLGYDDTTGQLSTTPNISATPPNQASIPELTHPSYDPITEELVRLAVDELTYANCDSGVTLAQDSTIQDEALIAGMEYGKLANTMKHKLSVKNKVRILVHQANAAYSYPWAYIIYRRSPPAASTETPA